MKKVSRTRGRGFHPIHAPIMASSLMSPPPIPSRPVIRSYPTATKKRIPPPAIAPISESSQKIVPGRKETAIPAAIPGREIISGIILWSRSINVITTRLRGKNKVYNVLKMCPVLDIEQQAQDSGKAFHKRIAPRNGMVANLHFPLRNRKLNTGDIVVKFDGLPTVRATGGRADNGFFQGNSIDANIQEASQTSPRITKRQQITGSDTIFDMLPPE